MDFWVFLGCFGLLCWVWRFDLGLCVLSGFPGFGRFLVVFELFAVEVGLLPLVAALFGSCLDLGFGFAWWFGLLLVISFALGVCCVFSLLY